MYDKKNIDKYYLSIYDNFSSIIPVPSATQDKGSSAFLTGTFNSSCKNSDKFLNKAPPPVKTIPFL